ncbi:TPA: hypothetical protein H1005_03940 [archaeon]|uniref:Uncharacterized protein n=1 Tax=Candidatus Naiadarchaeum limnaeum TaxID=2756139 RepID=A0A832XM45_9ARCH|nr:hypothetical protein [Candidatus Naiadarchaeales archaeon SRR2090153.bin1042]HIK00728.1 hypothetical protein [Candidatus Naiadarchaeum limnaeum]
MDAEKSLGVPTHMQYSLIAFAILIGVFALLYLLFSPIVKDILNAV